MVIKDLSVLQSSCDQHQIEPRNLIGLSAVATGTEERKKGICMVLQQCFPRTLSALVMMTAGHLLKARD